MPSPDENRPARWASLLGAGEAAALTIAALVALVFHATFPGKRPSDEDYAAVRQVLAAEARPSDAVLLYPWWTERARLFVPPQVPVVGYFGSDGNPLTAHPRIWLLAQPELPRSDLDGFLRQFSVQRAPLGAPRRLGNLELSLHQNLRHRPLLFSAAEAYAAARVYVEGPNGRLDCPFDGAAHRCPGKNLYVAPEWHEILFEPRRCLWFHAPGGPDRLVAEFTVPPGDLSLEAGIIWEWAPRHEPQLTTVNLGVDDVESGRQLLGVSIPPAREGVQRAQLPAAQLGGSRSVRLWVQSDNSQWRETCVDLFSFGPGGAR